MLLRTKLDEPLAERLTVDADRYERSVAAHARVLLREALGQPFPVPASGRPNESQPAEAPR